MVTPTTRRAGDKTKPNPFTVLIVANPLLETSLDSGVFRTDPVMSDRPAFDAAVKYIDDSLFGKLAGMKENLLGDPAIEPKVRLLTLFDAGLAEDQQNSFVSNDNRSSMLIARRARITAFLSANQIIADVVYAVSKSSSHDRASAWYTSDDEAGPKTAFTLDNVTKHHCHNYRIPGTIGIHTTASSLTAAHEFGHAISSYENGMIVDLYVDNSPALNCKRKRPIPTNFGTYQGATHASGKSRDSIGYPQSWTSFHCELRDKQRPALMDNYYLAKTNPDACLNDSITHAFIRDRVLVKIGR